MCSSARARVHLGTSSDTLGTHRIFSYCQRQQGRNTSSEHCSSPAHRRIQTSSSLSSSARCPGAPDCSSFPHPAAWICQRVSLSSPSKSHAVGCPRGGMIPSPTRCGFVFACEGILPACQPATRPPHSHSPSPTSKLTVASHHQQRPRPT